MEPKLSNKLIHSFNIFVKEVFHSSTLSLKVTQENVNEYHFIGKGISNRFIKQVFTHYGKEFGQNLIHDILLKNKLFFEKCISDQAGINVKMISFNTDLCDECFKVVVKELI